MRKYLWKITQDERTGYDTYDSAVVCATSVEEARRIHPDTVVGWKGYKDGLDSWATPDKVTAKKVGVADKSIPLNTVVCASFNAG